MASLALGFGRPGAVRLDPTASKRQTSRKTWKAISASTARRCRRGSRRSAPATT